ncbi:MAG TPA: acylphosphatase [Tepidiformaceae bacterium]
MTERRRIVVRGRVQGVGFRLFVRDLALDMGLSGWVRNLPDGRSLEAVAQGEREAVQRFVSLMRQGPPGSYVGEWEEAEEEVEPAMEGFRVTR